MRKDEIKRKEWNSGIGTDYLVRELIESKHGRLERLRSWLNLIESISDCELNGQHASHVIPMLSHLDNPSNAKRLKTLATWSVCLLDEIIREG